jgi:hypothetical protein
MKLEVRKQFFCLTSSELFNCFYLKALIDFYEHDIVWGQLTRDTYAKQLTSICFFCRGQHFGVGLHHRGDRRRQVEVRGQHESPRQQPLLRKGRLRHPARLDLGIFRLVSTLLHFQVSIKRLAFLDWFQL